MAGCGELPDGVEGCLRLMLPGETSRLQCTAAMAYSNSMVEPPAGISEVEDVEFEIFLHSFDRESMWAGAQDAQKIIELGKTTKEIANGLYKKAKYKLARMKYQKVHGIHCGILTRHILNECFCAFINTQTQTTVLMMHCTYCACSKQ